MGTVTISAQAYTVYGDNAGADVYHGASSHGAVWRAAAEDDQNRALVTATRILDRQSWLVAYNTFALRAAEADIVSAAYELALALLEGSDVQNVNTMEERIQSMSAGSVSITNYRSVGYATRFPQIVQELLVGYLGSSGSGAYASIATGVDTATVFPVDLGVN